MFVVIFEVQPKPEHWNDYLDLAAYLRPKLEAIDGFIDNERFKSRRTEGRVLSLSTWRDEKALVRWRSQGEHHGVQRRGRSEIFADYHLRVGEVTADTRPPPGLALAGQRFDETVAAAKAVTITEAAGESFEPPAPGPLGREWFESIAAPGKLVLLAGWPDAAAAAAWQPPPGSRHRRVRIIRDYGMTDRAEAPQFHAAPG